jgi:two-component system, NarL family, response regulator LiaR
MIRVLLVDDHSQIHRALSMINDVYIDVQVIGHAGNGEEAVQLAGQMRPDVIVMDVIMPVMDGIEATRRIHQQHPDIKILALSSFQDEASVRDMLKAGAVGYVLKNTSVEELTHTIRVAHSGKSVFSPEVTQILLETPKPESPDYGLSARETEVLRLMAKGQNNREIANVLTISEATVKFHVRGILSKLGVSGRVEAVALAIEHNLTT